MNDLPWYSLELTDDVAGARRAIEIQDKFGRLFFVEQLGGPNVAMYSTGLLGDADGYRLYFSPATAANDRLAAFLRQIGAEPCERPTDVRALLVGDTQTMRELLGFLPA
jgi:hypothetical protein